MKADCRPSYFWDHFLGQNMAAIFWPFLKIDWARENGQSPFDSRKPKKRSSPFSKPMTLFLSERTKKNKPPSPCPSAIQPRAQEAHRASRQATTNQQTKLTNNYQRTHQPTNNPANKQAKQLANPQSNHTLPTNQTTNPPTSPPKLRCKGSGRSKAIIGTFWFRFHSLAI